MWDADEARIGAREAFFIPSLIAAGYLLLNLATASRHGYFRDALYYLAGAGRIRSSTQTGALLFIVD